jgi:hypothetical protein
MSLMKQLSTLAKSKQGKDLLEKAKTIANDPKTREKIDDAREKLSGQIETAKQKMAEKKAKDGEQSGSQPTYGDGQAASSTPQYGEQAAADPAPTYGDGSAQSSTPQYGEASPSGNPPAPHSEPVESANPTYGEQEGDKPLYGEDGPKAA